MTRSRNARAMLAAAALAAASLAVLSSPVSATPTALARTQHPAIAKLFRGTAQVELGEHFAEFAVLSGLVGTNAANLAGAVRGETYEHATLYPLFAKQATKDGCPAVARRFSEVASDEATHAAAFGVALTSLSNAKVAVPAPPSASPEVVTAGRPACPGTRTQANLVTAMHGEAFAYAEYLADAAQAARTQHPAIAKLFRGTAQVELGEHFAEFAVLSGLVGTNAANLAGAVRGETYEHATLYPLFAKQATKDGCPAVASRFSEVASDEGAHAAAFGVALTSLSNAKVAVPAPPSASPEVVTAGRPACPRTRTQADLVTAMHGEAFAYAEYLADAAQATRS